MEELYFSFEKFLLLAFALSIPPIQKNNLPAEISVIFN